MNFAMLFAVVAVVAVVVYARRRRTQGHPQSAAWLVGSAIAIFLVLAALLMLIFIVGTLLFGG